MRIAALTASYSLLGVSGAVLYFPDRMAPLARDRNAGLAMPIDMIESLGEPVVVLSAQEIAQAIDYQ